MGVGDAGDQEQGEGRGDEGGAHAPGSSELHLVLQGAVDRDRQPALSRWERVARRERRAGEAQAMAQRGGARPEIRLLVTDAWLRSSHGRP